MEGTIWDEFSLNRHVVFPFEIPSSWTKGFSVDHGFRNPTAVNWYAIDFDGNIYLYDEHYQVEKPVSYHAEIIKLKGLTLGICDPSMHNKTQSREGRIYSIADEYQDYGVTLIPASHSDELAQLNRVNEWFKQDRIKIFKSCPNTIREVSSWKWKPVRGNDKNDPETPIDKDNHTCDNLKQIVASRLSGPYKAVVPSYTEHSLTRYINETKKERVFAAVS